MSCVKYTQQQLDDARDAYHKLMLGQALVEITDQNGERVRFAQANRNNLYRYIQEMEAQLCTSAPMKSVRPMGFIF